MITYNPLLCCDFYKCVHAEQYPHGITKIASTYTPRMSRLTDTNYITFFGAQAFIKEYLIDAFNKYFFNRPEEEVVEEYNRVLTATLGKGSYDAEKIVKLHRLGYLPIMVLAVPEGMKTAIGVPQSVFVNTHPDFAWLTNALETMYSTYMWHTQIAATVGSKYRKIVDTYKKETCDDNVRSERLLGDFSMRGQHSVESATKASGAWLLSFLNTATVPAIMWLEDNYNCDCTKEEVGFGAISTEHSVMCSNYAVDGDEITFIKRLLTEVYPNHSFSMVSDSYDYWNLVTNLLPQCKEEIMNHNGTLSIRGDSGDPVEIIAGKEIYHIDEDLGNLFEDEDTIDWLVEWAEDENIQNAGVKYFLYKGKYYIVNLIPEWEKEHTYSDNDYWVIDTYQATWNEIEPSAQLLGTVWSLWQTFGGTINSKGYKVLDSHIKAIYGDSITPQRCEEIYRRLMSQGFAISNVTLGVGSFSFMCLETIDDEGNPHYNPYTRDTFGIAIKATYGEDKDGNPIMIHKQPKENSWKKSQKGCCIVSLDGKSYTDGYTLRESLVHGNLLQPVFKNGKFIKEYSLKTIRDRMYNEGVIYE